MSNAIDIAKFFIKRGLDVSRNTYDGNMKLQKLMTRISLFYRRLFMYSSGQVWGQQRSS